jgi:hypothetical protein
MTIRSRRSASRLVKRRWRAHAAPWRRGLGGPGALRFWPSIIERCRRWLRQWWRRWRRGIRSGAGVGGIRRPRQGALAFLAGGGGKQQVAPRLDRRRGLGLLRCRRGVTASARCLVGPRRRRGRRRVRLAGIVRSRLVSIEQETILRVLIAWRPAGRLQHSFRLRRRIGAKPARNNLQLASNRPKREHDRAGASRDRTRYDQSIAKAEFLDRDPITNRQETGQQDANAGNEQRNHHRIDPRAARKNRSRRCHDTVIIWASPTANCDR